MKKVTLLFIATILICISKAQVQTPTLYVSGTVLSNEKMLVSVRGTKTIEGMVVNAEYNGKTIKTKTDHKGHAILDFSVLTGGVEVQGGIAEIKILDKKGIVLNTANTTIVNGSPAFTTPILNPIPKNLGKGDVVTISGRNLGADAKLSCGNQIQETLAASDSELTIFMETKPGEQKTYVITLNGVSETQTVNVYSLDFALPKSSIKPKENIQAMVHYESIPEGTKLIFTNKSPEAIKMTIPGAENVANECIYTVANKNGSIPVNITGILSGNFRIALDTNFTNAKKKD